MRCFVICVGFILSISPAIACGLNGVDDGGPPCGGGMLPLDTTKQTSTDEIMNTIIEKSTKESFGDRATVVHDSKDKDKTNIKNENSVKKHHE
jgi:hypothetical protein